MLNWETEAILAERAGDWKEPYKLYSPNVLTEMPIAVVDKNGTRAAAEAFTAFLFTPEAQKAFVDNGLRSVKAEGKAYAAGKFPSFKEFTIATFSGWPCTSPGRCSGPAAR